uniref:C-type lectin domain-containing protein n=1 Tax=Acrobeloides nanus TaxID=290746 RepID=A0A914EED9_9BILA
MNGFYFLVISILPIAISQCPSTGRLGPDNHCYAAYNSTGPGMPLDWTNAARYCRKLNGNLASIHDGFVNSFLWDWSKDPTVGDIWIGLYCSTSQTNDTYAWIDKSAYDYKNWVQLQTNCDKFGNACAYMQSQDGKWTTYLMCTFDAKSFICEF